MDMIKTKSIFCALLISIGMFLVSCGQESPDREPQEKDEKIIQAVSKLGKKLGIPTPTNDMLVELIRFKTQQTAKPAPAGL